MNRFWKKGLSFALMGTFSSGLVGNNVACARYEKDIARFKVSLPDAFIDRKAHFFGENNLYLRTYHNRNESLKVILLDKCDTRDICLGVAHTGYFGSQVYKYHYVDISPKISQLISKLKTILKEASKLNDCDKDMDKIRELKRKYMDTFDVLGEVVVGDYYAQEKDKEYREIFSCL